SQSVPFSSTNPRRVRPWRPSSRLLSTDLTFRVSRSAFRDPKRYGLVQGPGTRREFRLYIDGSQRLPIPKRAREQPSLRWRFRLVNSLSNRGTDETLASARVS